MYCRVCGESNQEDARNCKRCGQRLTWDHDNGPGSGRQSGRGHSTQPPPIDGYGTSAPGGYGPGAPRTPGGYGPAAPGGYRSGAPGGYQTPQSVPNYLIQAIVVTLFCCLPIGVVSIVYATQVNGKIAAGDYSGAQEMSNKARIWSWWSFGLGLLAAVPYIALTFLGVLSGF